MTRIRRALECFALTPIALFALLLALIILPAVYVVHKYKSVVLRLRLRHAWPAHTWILFAYTQSALWAPCLESEVIPRLGSECLVIDRSAPDWKQRHPIEARAIEHWGGYYEYNPLVILFPSWRPVRVVRLYQAFRDKKHGKPKTLDAELAQLFALVEAQRARRG